MESPEYLSQLYQISASLRPEKNLPRCDDSSETMISKVDIGGFHNTRTFKQIKFIRKIEDSIGSKRYYSQISIEISGY